MVALEPAVRREWNDPSKYLERETARDIDVGGCLHLLESSDLPVHQHHPSVEGLQIYEIIIRQDQTFYLRAPIDKGIVVETCNLDDVRFRGTESLIRMSTARSDQSQRSSTNQALFLSEASTGRTPLTRYSHSE
jgi:hypothetical protein